MTFWKRPNNSGREQIGDCQWLETGEGMTIKEQDKGIFWGDRTVLYPDYNGGYTNLHVLTFVALYTKKSQYYYMII